MAHKYCSLTVNVFSSGSAVPIHKLNTKKNYVNLDVNLIRSKELTAVEKTVLAIALSMAETWKFNVRGITRYTREGPDSVKKALNGLEEKGYMHRERIRRKGKYSGIVYNFYEHPSLNPNFAKSASPETEMPKEENPLQPVPLEEKPPVANQQINTINTDIIKSRNINGKDNQSINPTSVTENIRSKLEYNILTERYDRRLLDNVVSIIAGAMLYRGEVMEIGIGKQYPTLYVQSQLQKIGSMHIEQILDSFERVKPTVTNIKAYLLTALVNAAETLDMGYEYGDY